MPSFKQTDERNIHGELQLMKWNPRRDLMAIAMKTGEVCLHRLANWQKVWTLAPVFVVPLDVKEPSEAGVEPVKREHIHISALEWRPDGKVLAVGYKMNILNPRQDGTGVVSSVALVDCENADILHVIELKESVVTSLCWSQKLPSKSEETGQDTEQEQFYEIHTLNEFVPKLKSLPKSHVNRLSPSITMRQLTEENLDDLMRVASLDMLNILAVGTNTGKVDIFALGLLKCGSILIPGALSVLHLSYSDDLGLMNIMVESESQPVSCSMFCYSLSHLQAKSGHFLAVAHIYAQVLALIRYLNETVQAIKDTWEDILIEIDSKLSNYVQRQNGPAPEVEATDSSTLLADEFMELLVFGTPTDSLEKFLHDLSEKGLKKLGHSIELTYSNIQKLVVINLQRVGYHIFCYMNTLKGISLWKTEFGQVGLELDQVTHSMKAVAALLMKSIELQQVVDSSVRNVKAFFRWLYTVMIRLYNDSTPSQSQQEVVKISQQDLQFVGEFIEENFATNKPEVVNETADSLEMGDMGTDSGQKRPTSSNFTLERVGQYLKEEDLCHVNCSMNNLSLNPWMNYLKERPHFPYSLPSEIDQKLCLYPHNQDKSLLQEHKALEKAVLSTFDGLSISFENKYTLISQLNDIVTVAANTDLKMCKRPKAVHITGPDGLMQVIADGKLPASKLFLLKYSFQLSNRIDGSAVSFAVVDLDETATDAVPVTRPILIVDFDFYNLDTLSLLLNDKACNCSYIAQVPVSLMVSKTVAIDASMPKCDLQSICPEVEVILSTDGSLNGLYFKKVDNMRSLYLAVSQRKLACVASNRRVRIYETDVVDEEDEEELDKSGLETFVDGIVSV